MSGSILGHLIHLSNHFDFLMIDIEIEIWCDDGNHITNRMIKTRLKRQTCQIVARTAFASAGQYSAGCVGVRRSSIDVYGFRSRPGRRGRVVVLGTHLGSTFGSSHLVGHFKSTALNNQIQINMFNLVIIIQLIIISLNYYFIISIIKQFNY